MSGASSQTQPVGTLVYGWRSQPHKCGARWPVRARRSREWVANPNEGYSSTAGVLYGDGSYRAVRGAWGAGSSADGARDESDTILYIGGHASKLCHLALQSTCDETRVCTETGRSMDADLTSETLRY